MLFTTFFTAVEVMSWILIHPRHFSSATSHTDFICYLATLFGLYLCFFFCDTPGLYPTTSDHTLFSFCGI